jgi:hypothetical protein
MFNINDLLGKVKALRQSDIGIRMSIKSAIIKNTNIDIPVENISTKSGKVIIKNIPQIVKGEIFIKRLQILKDIHLSLGNDRLKDFI